MSSNPWPQVYLIGALKTGTTSLHAFFKKHRGFYVPDKKYLRYFAREIHASFSWGANEEAHRALYLEAFKGAGPEDVAIDCDNMTMLNPHAPRRIAAVRPDAKIIVVLRDPIERAWSHYLSNTERATETRDPRQAILGLATAQPGMDVPDEYYLDGMYHMLLMRFAQYFPRRQFHLIDYNRLLTHPDEVQEELCRFLEVKQDNAIRLGSFRENQTHVARGSVVRSLHRFRHTRLGGLIRDATPEFLRNRLLALFFSSTAKKSIPQDIYAILALGYAEDAESLNAGWGFNANKWIFAWQRNHGTSASLSSKSGSLVNTGIVYKAARAAAQMARINYARWANDDSKSDTVAKLRRELKSSSPLAVPKTEAEQAWHRNINELVYYACNRYPAAFLTWPVVRKTMFFDNIPYAAVEFNYLRSLPDWSARWQLSIAENPFGFPSLFPYYKTASGNTIHHSYHIARFERSSGRPISDFNYIVEFGGGYGSMHRVARQAGFKGVYVIYDLECFSALQRYYLRSIGSNVAETPDRAEPESVVCISTRSELEAVLQRMTGKEGLFIATWSLSETSLEFRREFTPLIAGFSAYLIAYQDHFKEVDNATAFEALTQSLASGVEWKVEPIRHMAGNAYLFGDRTAKNV
jgi:hypothetical protein